MDVRRIIVAIAASTSLLAGSLAFSVPSAQAQSTTAPAIVFPTAAKYKFANCTALHKVYPHGVGKSNARDKVRGKTKPVTTFKRSTSLYNKIVRYRSDLDRDKDGVACEKK
ncbi:excalibur calcium-binding domain-containing protein [Propionicimonas paludicola]|uniref:Excalibur calcium-binding domain-containing protein n=1 Tax=Propionicimonas paludicola TaxID=185243 RepID=A0A2A9CRC9_9ACTN|nr:excalibur calcium-binding domain-containing protein [Propionicimonas paludicola]PFG16676.1 excalibur calcium-binding domain-containing protein [Propionicimonas paludicola]